MELKYVAEWFRFADTDLASAEFLQSMQPQPLEVICFHCQQSAEKYLKGYLIYRGVEDPPKIHNLDTLCEMCLKYDERFRELKRACNALTIYGIQPRYPNEIVIEERNMHKAFEYIRQIRGSDALTELRQIIQIETV